MSQNIDSILDAAEQQQASDVFLQENEVPRLKINGQIIVFGKEPLSVVDMGAFWQACGANAQGDGDRDRDSGFISPTHTRYRVNLHRTMGRLGAVLRRIKTNVPGLNALGAPEWLLTRWAAREHGLILVTGPTGSGKSTTIASLLQWMNENQVRHIVTIEDPIEYQFTSNRCHFTQRQVGRDTGTFATGLRSALRQAPDVIFLGEVRDYETALTALQASETGHLVLSTMHSEKVADTMERYLNLFPTEHAKHGTNLLANQLSGILCQKLVESADGGLHLLVEHVENAGAMRDWIARRELQSIDQYIGRGSDPAAVSFLQSTIKALQAKIITEATAMASVSNEAELRRAMRGIG
ncbi:MAG TPA: ATPase, T2SS/T4P/T4SS family [Candidatus Udaeobacter sp.]|nr:ATPase, T2SS/T4P/T4SS family [Candidatus Udaeobacter sp.]